MLKQFTAVLTVGLIGVEGVAGEVYDHKSYRQPDRKHIEIFVGDAGYGRMISVDYGTGAGAPTGTIDMLKNFGVVSPVSITASHVQFTPSPFREDNCRPFVGEKCELDEPVHPPEESGDMFTGMSSSGAVSNVANAIVSTSYGLPIADRPGQGFWKPRPNVIVRISAAPVPRRHVSFLPLARRNC